MHPQTPPPPPCFHRAPATRLADPDLMQQWQDIGTAEGLSLEWMLDRRRDPQEALT